MLTPEQLAMRSGIIGSSEIGAICGLSPYATAHDVYAEKLGLVPPFEGNEATEFGHLMEPIILGHYARTFDIALDRRSVTHRHPDHPAFACTPDALVRDGGKPAWIVEAKTASWRVAHRWGQPGTDDVPEEYLLQCAWQMAIMDLPRVDLHAIVDRQFRTYTLTRHEPLEQHLLAKAAEFWDRVQTHNPPPVDGSDGCSTLLSLLHAAPSAKARQASTDELELALQLKALQDQRKEIEAQEQLLKNQLCDAIGDDKGIKGEFGSLTWSKPGTRTKTDWEGLAKHLQPTPAQLDKFTHTIHTRRALRPYWKKEAAK